MELQGGICKRGERRRIESVLRAWRAGVWPCKARIIKEQLRGITATHSSTLAWRIPWMEEPHRLQSMGSQRVRHDWATSLSLFTFLHWRRKWQPTRVLAWGIPGTGEPGGLPSMALHRVGHDWSDLAAAAKCFLKLAVYLFFEERRGDVGRVVI